VLVKSFISVAAFTAVTGSVVSSAIASITIPTVPIGNPGNAADPTTGYGSVAYAYNIGSTEVTNAQYAAFLNAVAGTDTNNLYNINMAGGFGGVIRTGSPGSYTYSTVTGRENNPVNFVSFWDATRFANWLHNGQPTGAQSDATTEDGAYTLTSGGIIANTVTRNAGWQWAVTSEDEWYKAAYHQPASQGGDGDDYWVYPTSSNSVPTTAQANVFGNGINNTVPVGSYAPNFYGTFDMGGNVREWNEAIALLADNRGIRGGFFASNGGNNLQADTRNGSIASLDVLNSTGFRVVQVPGPSSVALLAFGGVMAARRRR
jgi:formylglycine-generating enzyme required for sulfatase activity